MGSLKYHYYCYARITMMKDYYQRLSKINDS